MSNNTYHCEVNAVWHVYQLNGSSIFSGNGPYENVTHGLHTPKVRQLRRNLKVHVKLYEIIHGNKYNISQEHTNKKHDTCTTFHDRMTNGSMSNHVPNFTIPKA